MPNAVDILDTLRGVAMADYLSVECTQTLRIVSCEHVLLEKRVPARQGATRTPRDTVPHPGGRYSTYVTRRVSFKTDTQENDNTPFNLGLQEPLRLSRLSERGSEAFAHPLPPQHTLPRTRDACTSICVDDIGPLLCASICLGDQRNVTREGSLHINPHRLRSLH